MDPHSLRLIYPCFLRKEETFEGHPYTLTCPKPHCSVPADDDLPTALTLLHEGMLHAVPYVRACGLIFDLPDPETKGEGELFFLEFDARDTLRILLSNAMVQTHTRPEKLARRLGLTRRSVKMLFDSAWPVSVETLIRAVEELGCKAEVPEAHQWKEAPVPTPIIPPEKRDFRVSFDRPRIERPRQSFR